MIENNHTPYIDHISERVVHLEYKNKKLEKEKELLEQQLQGKSTDELNNCQNRYHPRSCHVSAKRDSPETVKCTPKKVINKHQFDSVSKLDFSVDFDSNKKSSIEISKITEKPKIEITKFHNQGKIKEEGRVGKLRS